MKYFYSFLFILYLFLLPGSLKARSLDEIKRSGKIYVAFTSDDLKNINYQLALEFAKYLNVELIEVVIDWDEVFMNNGVIPDDLETNPEWSYTPDALKKADIICSTFTILEWRKRLFSFAETLYSAELLMIDKKAEQPQSYTDLIGKTIAFQHSTTFEDHMVQINKELGGGIDLRRTESSAETQRLLTEGKVYGIVLDADEALNFNVRNDHRYKIGYPISEVSRSAWAVEKNNPLKQEVENFFETIASNGVLDEIFYSNFEIRYSTFVETINKNIRHEQVHRDLDEILRSKKLVVALRDRNFIYKDGGQKQFMHALAEEFADYLGVSLEFVITPYFEKYWENENGEVVKDSAYTPEWFNYFDVACEVIAPIPWRQQKVDLIPVYPSSYSVIAKKGTRISSIASLSGLKGVTGKQTVYEDLLQKNNIKNFYYESINNFLPDVESGKADYTILYNAFAELSNYPELEVKLELGVADVCWAVRKDQPELKKEVEKFIRQSSENGLIRLLMKALKGNTLQTPEAFINSYYESFQTGQLPYVNYGADDGLPQEDVLSIFQDKKGYLWFGTNSGVVRYNGREMKVFNEKNGLKDNSVRDVRQDSSGLIYFATASGLAVFEHDSVTRTEFLGVSFKKIFIDRQNNKWLIGDDGVYCLTAENKLRSLNSEFTELPTMVYNITQDPKSRKLCFATAKGVFEFDPDGEVLIRLSDKDCFSLYIDVNDSIWMATKSGLYISDLEELRKKGSDMPLSSLNQRLHFPVNIITDITTNRFGSVWLISDSRILQITSTDQEPIVYEQEIGIKNNKILSFLIDQEDNIWIGFSGGLQRLTSRKGLRNFYPNTINSYIYSVFQDQQERIWITSNNGIFYFKEDLKSLTPLFGSKNKQFIGRMLPNGNILVANTEGLYEINNENLKILRQSIFNQLTLSLENLYVSTKGEIFLLTGINGIIYYCKDFFSQPIALKNRYTSNIFQLIEYEGQILGGNSSGIVRFNGGGFELLSPVSCNVWSLYAGEEDLFIGTDCGLGIVRNGRFDQMEIHPLDRSIVIKAIQPAKNRNYLWLGTNKGFSYYNLNTDKTEFTIDTKDGLSGDEITAGGLFLDHNDLLWVGTYHGLSNFNIRAKSTMNYSPVCYIERILLNGEPIRIETGRSFRHNENNFVFEITALSFSDEESVEYEFYLRGSGNNYSSYHRGKEFKAYYTNLPAGKYQFIYKAKGKNNIWGYAEQFEFTIRKAWYNTWVFRGTVILVLFLLIYSTYSIRMRAVQAQKRRLEQLVKERTHELEEANAEIEAQRDLATEQRDQIAVQQKEIMDSIHYAERIQRSLLPSDSLLKDILPEHFILFKPRDIVSGDFFWVAEKDGYIYAAAADCTGHGIPGAFMSMLGLAYLNEIISKAGAIAPDAVLNHLRQDIIRALNQQGKEGEAKDGMDIALVRFDREGKTLGFAGGNNPLYMIRKGVLTEIKGDKMPVAIHEKMPPFTLNELSLEKDDIIYLFSDGYADQFGGPKGKKFMYRRFKDLLEGSNHMDMISQGKMLNQTIESWKGNVEQIDDIVIIGIRF
ncbi:MAG: two-component regulator propeller domain-containing protein [Bacteroidota bacterium]